MPTLWGHSTITKKISVGGGYQEWRAAVGPRRGWGRVAGVATIGLPQLVTRRGRSLPLLFGPVGRAASSLAYPIDPASRRLTWLWTAPLIVDTEGRSAAHCTEQRQTKTLRAAILVGGIYNNVVCAYFVGRHFSI